MLTDEVTMDMTCAIGSILPSKFGIQIYDLTELDNDTQAMDFTMSFGSIHTPQPTVSTPESSPFLNSPMKKAAVPAVDAEITRSPLSTGITGSPKRTPSRGLVALDLLTGKSLAPDARRKSDSGIILGSPRAAGRLRGRKSIAAIEEFNPGSRRVSIGRDAWRQKQFGGEMVRAAGQEGIRDMIARLTPKKPTSTSRPGTPVSRPKVADEIMLTPGMIKREFGPKVASLVKVWEDNANPKVNEEEEDFPPITLAEFLALTNISFLDGLGPTTRRRTYVAPEGLTALQSPEFRDYAKAGAVSIPMLELYQFVSNSV